MSSVKALPDIDIFFSDWYNEVVFKSELVDQAPVRGCMIIRPYGYAIWEEIQYALNKEIRSLGARNAAFPLLIPYSFIAAEKDHIEGFSPEVVVVTHAGGKKLEEAYIIRPTSETIIHDAFSRWIRSWRDLPIKINQWCSVIRWEKKPKAFIRTGEFWWQEGHTAHETHQEANRQAHAARTMYEQFIKDVLNIPVICGQKPSVEKFAGALATYTMEAMMRDGKALQMGTSHVLNQSFSEAFSIKFQNRNDDLEFVHLTSWGVTTRLIGAVIMSHGDQKGLVLPWGLAPMQCIIVPIIKKGFEAQVFQVCQTVNHNLTALSIRSEIDNNEEETPGFKFNKWELKGAPIRIEIGMRDIEKNQLTLVMRDTGEKSIVSLSVFQDANQLKDFIKNISTAYSQRLYNNSLKRLEDNMRSCELLSEILTGNDDTEDSNPKEKNYFWKTNWCCAEDSYQEFKKKHLTVRCMLENEQATSGICCVHGATCEHKDKMRRVIVAKSY